MSNSDSTTLPLLNYFVYELQDPKDNSVFYVGKGTARRAEQHENEALKAEDGESKKTDKINPESVRCQFAPLVFNSRGLFREPF